MINTPIRIQQHHSDLATKGVILTLLEREYRWFISAAAGVDEHRFREHWLDGRWGVAEMVAVHTGWLEKLDEGLRLAKQGVPFEQIDWLEVERWEEAFYGRGSGQRRTTLLRDLKRAFQRFMTTAAQLPANNYGENGLLPRMFSYVGVCKFRLHATLIEAWSEGRLNGLRGPTVTALGPLAD
jgi:hypothetical protein